MMEKFELAPITAWKKESHGIEEINYTLLLAHVFGKPIKVEQAFMYFFRRYGLPNIPHDDYKDLCSYAFYTDDENILVKWHMNQGDYHYHLCAFANYKDWYNYSTKPSDDYFKQVQAAAEKDGLVFFGGWRPYFLTLWKKGKDSKAEFVGNKIQEAAIQKMWEDTDGANIDDVWDKIYALMEKNDTEICEKYLSVLQRPVIEWSFDKPFNDNSKYERQVEAGREQHEWILSLPEDHFLRRVYFTTMRLFEDWKRPTYIRDVYFCLDCEDYDGDGESVRYTEFAGLQVCECCFGKIENEILRRMSDILSWYKKIVDEQKKSVENDEALLKSIEK
jgi:hypothetical protein